MPYPSPKFVLVALTAAGGLVALLVASTGSLLLATIAGLVVLAIALLIARDRLRSTPDAVPDAGRRRFLGVAAVAGVALVGLGTGAGRGLRRLLRPNPGPILDAMASDLGDGAMDLIRTGHCPGRAGELQLILAPFSSSNYAGESKSLAPRDPRTSHAAVWPYLERIPLTVYAPGLIPGRRERTERVTLADLAPTTARLMGFDFAAPDGEPLPGIEPPVRPPKVIVTFVIDGGGWNFLLEWPDAWPNLRRLLRAGTSYRDAWAGSHPAVTASAHATIGTGALPNRHGVSGHNIRKGRTVVKAYGAPGEADPGDLLVPTLADAWADATGNRAWIGELGYQVWHLGMIGEAGRPGGELPVGVYWDEDENLWAPHHPERFRLPSSVPARATLTGYLEKHFGEEEGRRIDREGGKLVCCTDPIIDYQGDLIEATIASEPMGRTGTTDLLYINYKAPDYAGHTWNMQDERTAAAMRAVDRQLGRLVRQLESTFGPGGFALIVTADHGQCPLVDDAGGVRVDPVQLNEDIRRGFDLSFIELVDMVAPSEIFLNEAALRDAGLTGDDVAVFLGDYRYGDNIGWYVADDAIQHDRTDQRPFAAVLPTGMIRELGGGAVTGLGAGIYPEAEMEVPPLE